MKEVVVASIKRTPIGSYCGVLREIPVHKLAAEVMKVIIKEAGVNPELVDDVIMGQAYQNGECANLARMAVLEAGWPVEVCGVTLDRRCCSGLQSLWFGSMEIQTGNADIVVAGGAESMSQAEFYIPGQFIKWGAGGTRDAKWGFAPRNHGYLSMWGIPFYDRIQRARPMSQPIEIFGELNSMMTWAETAAKNEGISKQEADEWALNSYKKAIKAIESGIFKDQIVPISIPQGKGKSLVIDVDESPRREVTMDKLAKLSPVYENGICTAGNSSTENDGAAACVLTYPEKCSELGIEPMAYIRSFAVSGADPRLVYPSVPAAVFKALKKAGLTMEQIDLIEIQEAFACQTMADAKLMGLSKEDCNKKVNVNGSGISLGHPIGATGTMRLTTLIYEMKRRKARYGLVTICGGGGQGIAIVVERI